MSQTLGTRACDRAPEGMRSLDYVQGFTENNFCLSHVPNSRNLPNIRLTRGGKDIYNVNNLLCSQGAIWI